MSSYINLNGRLVASAQPVFSASNRAFLYGDALFETIRAIGGKPVFLEDHLSRLHRGMKFLGYAWNDMLNHGVLEEEIGRLLRRNRCAEGGIVRLTVFRNDGGLYAPQTDDVSVLLTCRNAPGQYLLNREGLMAGLYDEMRKPLSPLATLKSANALLFVKAARRRAELELDELFLLNEKGFLCEAVSSNLFLVINDRLVTPAPADGCLPGVMRKNVIKAGERIGMETIETHLLPSALEQADEVFVTNAASGLQWVKGFGRRRYYHKVAGRLTDEINRMAAEYLGDMP